MNAIKTLIDAAFNRAAAIACKGNHSFVRIPGKSKVVFYYYVYPVCVLDFNNRSFKLDHCCWETLSMTITLNAYHDELTARDFTCVKVE